MANKLTFTGASSQTYDGSTAVTINIPITADISKGLMGINLLKYTRDLSNFVNQSHVNNKICTSGYGELIQTTDGIKLNFKGNNYACIYVPVSDYTIKSGVVYTISFEYRGTITTFGGVWFERSPVSNLNVASNPATLVNNTTTWQKCRFTVITSVAIARDTTVFWLGLFYGAARASTDWIEIKKGSLKMERGNIAAPVWTPSLEEDPNYDITSIVQPSQFSYLAAWVDTELRAINPSSITVGKASSADKVNHKLKFNVYSGGGAATVTEYDGSADTTVSINSYSSGTGISITTNTISLATSGVSASTYGSATAIPQMAVDKYGRITSASNKYIDPINPMRLLWQNQSPSANQAAQTVNITKDLVDTNFDFLCLVIQSNNTIFIPRTDVNMFNISIPKDYHITNHVLTATLHISEHREVYITQFDWGTITLTLKDAYKTGVNSFSTSMDNGCSKLFMVFGGKFTSNYMKYMG